MESVDLKASVYKMDLFHKYLQINKVITGKTTLVTESP